MKEHGRDLLCLFRPAARQLCLHHTNYYNPVRQVRAEVSYFCYDSFALNIVTTSWLCFASANCWRCFKVIIKFGHFHRVMTGTGTDEGKTGEILHLNALA